MKKIFALLLSFSLVICILFIPKCVKAETLNNYKYSATVIVNNWKDDSYYVVDFLSNEPIVYVHGGISGFCFLDSSFSDYKINATKHSVDGSISSYDISSLYSTGGQNPVYYINANCPDSLGLPYWELLSSNCITFDNFDNARNYLVNGDDSGAIFKPETTDVLEYDSSIELPQSMTATYNIYSDKDFVDINDVQKVLQVAIKSITNNFYNNMVWSQSVDTTDYITEFYGSATINLPSFLKLTNPTVSDIYNCTTESLDIFFPLLNSDDDSLTINTSSSNAVTYNFRQYYKSLFKYLIDNDYVNCTTYSEENFVSSLRDLIQMTTIDNDTTCHVFVRNRVDNKVSNWVSFKWGSSVQNWNEISAVDKDGNVSDSPASNDVVTDSQYTPTYTPPTEVEEANTNSFLAFIKSGFGLLGDNGLIAMFQSIFLFLPSWLFSLLATGVSSMVLVAIIKAVVK